MSKKTLLFFSAVFFLLVFFSSITIFAQSGGTNLLGDSTADINGNGKVDIFDFNTLVSNFGKSVTPTTINVKSFGAKGDGYQDDTEAFEKALDAAKTDPRSIKKIYIPNGFYIIKSLNLTNMSVKVEGESMAGTRLMATNQTASAPVIDMTGSQYSELENLTVIGGGTRFDGQSSGIKPTVGILMAGAKVNAPGATKFLIKDILVRGEFSQAAVYIYGTCCNSYINLYADSYLDGVPGLVVTGTNRLNVTSPYTEIATGLLDTVDLNFIEAEIHDLSNVGFDGQRVSQGKTKTILIDNARSLGFVGGVFSSCGGTSIVEMLGENKQIVFDKNTFASAEGNCPLPVANTFYIDGKTDGLSIRNPNIDGGVSAQGAVINGSAQALLNGLTIEGSVRAANRFNQNAALISIAGHQNVSPTQPTITNSRIMADGLAISPGGSITATQIINPGSVGLMPGAQDLSTKSQ
jgi:hypothetical protein